jgi:tRNA-dihydrouridine synthase B
MLKIGKIELNHPVVLAPLSGYTDVAMRRLCRDFGVELTFPGVMLAKSAANPRVLKKPCFRPQGNESPIGAQILGTEIEYMVKAAVDLEAAGYDMIDLNFACPAPKVLRRGRGGHMLNSPQSVLEIFSNVREAIESPMSVKLRIGYSESEQCMSNFFTIAEGLAAAGADALVVHGRTTLQKYSGKSDWEPIRKLKKMLPQTTIIGSGDIFEPEDVIDRLSQCGVDGILLARGAVGNPWLVSEAIALLEGREKPEPPSVEQVGRVMLRHLELLFENYDPAKATRYFRKFAAQYCRRHSQRKKTQCYLFEADDHIELVPRIKECFGLSE